MISVTNIHKNFGTSADVIGGVSCLTDQGKTASLIGPSGCGKTTLLNILAGLDTATSGKFSIQNNEKADLIPAYMMQDPALLPWRTLFENAVLGVEITNGKSAIPLTSVLEYLKEFDLEQYASLYPHESSGGMLQRIALIRTMLVASPVLFLDEPFSNLDYDIKVRIQRRMLKHHLENETTVLLVTHDIEDAIALSDKIIILSEKPTVVKKEIEIDLGLKEKDPIAARKTDRFREYFVEIIDELKYLERNETA